MKRIFALLLTAVLVVGSMIPVFAAGDSNMDGGGGDLGHGNSASKWSPGMDGVRITVVNAATHAVSAGPVDLTNKKPSAGVVHFGRVCKLSYNAGRGLSPVVGGYTYRNPAQSLPRIISTGSQPANIEAIRSYFTDEQVIRALAGYVGMDFNKLVSGTYKLVVEPIAYLRYNNQNFAMTATEAALYDRVVKGNLHYWMKTLTHKNLPLSIFLEEADLGYPAWTGGHNQRVSNEQIIASLGIGIVRFREETEPPTLTGFDYEYRVDTDVITSVVVSGGQSDPDHPVSVQFIIGGRTYTVGNVFYPEGDSQLAWVKWHTPSEPGVYEIQIRATGAGTAQSVIRANVVTLEGKDPPNPVADDRNNTFTSAPLPEFPQITAASWGVWTPRWQADRVWIENWEKCWHEENGKRWFHWVDNGRWEDQGGWVFDYNSYSASLSAEMEITPDSSSPSATASTMKSGYGIREQVTAAVTTNQSTAVTAAQNALTRFPEFKYLNFWRLLDPVIAGKRSEFSFRENPFSTYRNPTHFTPIWYPNGSYTPHTYLLDCWTPVGMLSMNLSDSVTIQGDLWDEWHVAPG